MTLNNLPNCVDFDLKIGDVVLLLPNLIESGILPRYLGKEAVINSFPDNHEVVTLKVLEDNCFWWANRKVIRFVRRGDE